MKIARHAGGSLRDALVGLEAVMECGNNTVMLETVDSLIGSDFNRSSYCDLVSNMINGDYKESISIMRRETDKGSDPYSLLLDLLDFSHDMMLSKLFSSVDFLNMEEDFKEEWLSVVTENDIDVFLNIHSIIMKYVNSSSNAIRVDISLETCIIEAVSNIKGAK